MTCVSRLRYSPHFKCNIDLCDMWVADCSAKNYGKHLKFSFSDRYYRHHNLLLHKIVSDACVWNPRPDIFTHTDHIDGNTRNNHPKNLRHCNHHLNMLNRHYDPETETPPGLTLNKYKTKNGKFFSLWRFGKNSCPVKYFRNKKLAIDFAKDFNVKYFEALYDAYVKSPASGDRAEWRRYWSKRFISHDKFTKEDRPSVLNLQKFIVYTPLYNKMCT